MSLEDLSTTGPVPNHAYEQLKARYERLMEISRQLNSTLDLGTLLNRIVRGAAELTDTEEASILLIDPTTGELRFEAASNLSGSAMAAIPVPLEGSLAGWVATHGEPEIVHDARNDSRWFANVDETIEFTTRNLLAVPLKTQDEIIGVLEAINKHADQPWSQDDINTLMSLASQAAIAIQNTRLFQQSDFVAEMVHELRTPLAALRASTALLMRPTLPENRREEMLQAMRSETERLTQMATDFLDLARLESGRTRIDMSEFEMLELVRECTDLVTQQACERDIVIQAHGEPVSAQADRNQIKRVLLNLLTNAIKYNREHGAIYCVVEQLADQPGCVTVRVQDTGYGLNEEDRRRVFDKFYRVPDRTSSATGTGLGLSIAQKIIEAHGGEIGCESQVNVGTTFYFTLPRGNSPASPDNILPGSAEFSPSS